MTAPDSFTELTTKTGRCHFLLKPLGDMQICMCIVESVVYCMYSVILMVQKS